MAKRYKCPYCDERLERDDLIDHIEEVHEDLIPEDQTPTQVVFNTINKKTHGTCVMCKKPTDWNEKAGRYNRICLDPRCREKMREEFKSNSLKKHGKYNFTADPKFQEKMLKGRKISSTYKFTDGGIVDYVGTYEKNFLEFIDVVMNIDSKDIMAPGPTIAYEYNGETHHWITDFYYIPGNLVLDIKDGGKNPNTRPMEEYREKQIAKEKAIKKLKKYNYLRLTDNNFGQFMEVLADLKSMALDLSQKQIITKINESSVEEMSVAMSTVPPMYSADASVVIATNRLQDERIALSSLDFNDNLLIDDEIEGVIKISKKEFKEKYKIKEQFLFEKDESYYNLLKSFITKDECIHKGIYNNLSSFNTLFEGAIYFDSKFRKVENDKVLQEMQDTISKLNDSIVVIGEDILIRNDKLQLVEEVDTIKLHNDLKVSLEGYEDGVFIIRPSEDKEDLEDQYKHFIAQNDDQKMKADTMSLALYGMTNYDHYHILTAKFRKENELEYNSHDETIVKEDVELLDLHSEFGCSSKEDLESKIRYIKYNNMNTIGRVILYPTLNTEVLQTEYMKYMALDDNYKSQSDRIAMEVFGKTNREIYNICQDTITKNKSEEEKVSPDESDIEKTDAFVSDTPLLTPEELNTKVHEDYSCFNDKDAKIIEDWRTSYTKSGFGLINEDYRSLNIKRLNILRKAIYENNTEAIIQCGWNPEVEFTSENRIKATNLVSQRVKANKGIIPYDFASNINESYVLEIKEFPVQVDDKGNLLIKNIKKINFEHEYNAAHKFLMTYDKVGNIDGMKYELAKLFFLNKLLEDRIFNSKHDDKDREKHVKTRARVLNDFNKYFEVVAEKDREFIFSTYYDETPFSDAIIKINKPTLSAVATGIKSLIKG